jgi:hypothetical protein
MDKKKDANYAFQERTFDGAAAMWLRKSADEAPEVGTYNYDNVEIQSYDQGVTDLADFNSQWTTTLYGETISSKGKQSDSAQVNIDTLLNDIWFCAMIDDFGKMGSLLERARLMGIQYPADYTMKNLFGDSTLWSRVHDTEFKLAGRDTAIRLLSQYHLSGR